MIQINGHQITLDNVMEAIVGIGAAIWFVRMLWREL